MITRTFLILFLCSVPLFGMAQDKDLKVNEETNLIEVVYYHDNGEISQKGTFNLERKLHGQWLSFNEKGEKIAMGSYENGLKTGKWYFWSVDSIKEVEYKDNAIASVNSKKIDLLKVDKN